MSGLYARIREEERKSQAWDMYLQRFHFMINGQLKYQSFNEWYGVITGGNLDLRPADEILAEVEAIREELKGV